MLNVKNVLQLSTKESRTNDSKVTENHCISAFIKTFVLGTAMLSTSVFAQIDIDAQRDIERFQIKDYHSKPQESKFNAEQYMQVSLENMFDNTNGFECDANKRSAICTIPSYNLNIHNLTLRDFRYTIDYKDSRVIERLSGKFANDEYEDTAIQQFMPKQFECSDFTQLHNENNQVNEQLVCSIKSDTYDIWFRLRAEVFTSLLKDKKAFELLSKGVDFLNSVASQVADTRNTKEFDRKLHDTLKVLKQINVNLYGIEVAITKPHLPQKVYELIFDTEAYSSFSREKQLSQTLYNTGVGYIYGHAMGYVWGNDAIDERTKEGFHAVLVALRDSAMLDSNIRTVSIKITNRTKQGFNLGRATKKILHKIDKVQKPQKEYLGRTINSFDGTFFNRYRIEVEALRAKPERVSSSKTQGF